MSSFPRLLQMYRCLVEVERELVDSDRQVLVGASSTKTSKKKKTRAPRVTVSHGERYDFLLPLLRVLRDAAEPLPPREIASILGITPKAASRRLLRALALNYVVRVGGARYRITDSVRSVPGL